MRQLTWFLLLLLSLLVVSCYHRKDTKIETSGFISWRKNRPQIWTDYKGIRPWETTHAAQSYIWFYFYSKELKDSIEVNVTTYFIPDSSWFDPLKINDEVLNHERRHFDLGEISNRQVRKFLLEWNGRDYDDFYAYLQGGNFKNQAFAQQALYDSQTNHSLNHQMQKNWDRKIDSLLAVYKDFDSPVFRIRINKIKNY